MTLVQGGQADLIQEHSGQHRETLAMGFYTDGGTNSSIQNTAWPSGNLKPSGTRGLSGGLKITKRKCQGLGLLTLLTYQDSSCRQARVCGYHLGGDGGPAA